MGAWGAVAVGKLGTFLGFVALLWLVTYMPFSPDLGLITQQPTIRMNLASIDPTTGAFPASRLEDACNHRPFLLRPIASRPDSVKVVFVADRRDFGEVTYDCDTGDMLNRKRY